MLCLLAGCATGGGARPAGDDQGDVPDVPEPDIDPDAAEDAGPADDGGPQLVCDPRFRLSPDPPVEGRDLEADVTDATAWVWVGLSASGPGAPTVSEDAPFVTGTGPFTWNYRIRGHAAGVLSLTFTADSGSTVVARCDVRVAPGAPTDGGDADADAGDAGDGAGPPPSNRYGIGLVGPGDAFDLDLAADLTGPGGWVKLIFPGITRDTTGPDPSWIAGVRESYARDLVPVIRLNRPWSDGGARNDADPGSNYLRYTILASAYRRVVEGLPLRDGWPIWLEIHNEPNLCGEWPCSPGTVPGDWISYDQMAREYAAMLRDVADALRAIGDPRIRILNAGLAPGGALRCQCGGPGYEAGVTAVDFLTAMISPAGGVPDLFDRLDGFASHSYPAEGMGWGFFVPYDRAGPGLRFFEAELAAIGRGDLAVYLTETGWCTPGDRCRENGGTRDEIADWTVRAYSEFWLTHPNVAAVMPFMLRDAPWNDFAWVDPSGAHYPVYDRVRALRCTTIPGRCP